uniref:FYVE-type domain-containing protein n=1 Tax=Mesocestoides corti TaxID=53468 RepID=A0A5K3ESL1_MESCO
MQLPVEETVKVPYQNALFCSTNAVSDCKSAPTAMDEEPGTSTDLENPSFTLESATFPELLASEQKSQCCLSELTPIFKKIELSGTETARLLETVSATQYENSSTTKAQIFSEALCDFEDSTNQMPMSTMESVVETMGTIQEPAAEEMLGESERQSCNKEAGEVARVVEGESHVINIGGPSHSSVTEHKRLAESGPSMCEDQNYPIETPGSGGLTKTGSPDAPPSSFSVLARDPPEWAADGSSPVCMSCGTRFTMLRRRHHCRACGRLLCASCTPHRVPLPATFSASSTSSTEPSLIRLVSSSSPSNDGAETRLHRVCNDCFNLVNAASYDGNTQGRRHQTPDTSAAPSQRLESPPTILASPSPPISTTPLPVPSSSSAQVRPPIQRRPYSPQLAVSRLKDDCLIPMDDDTNKWPPLVASSAPELTLEPRPPESRISQLLEQGGTVTFAVTRNLHVLVGCHNTTSSSGAVWYFASHGLYAVGQEEVGLLIRRRDCESLPPLDALWQFYLLYEMAFTRSSFVQPSNFAQASAPIDEGFCLLQACPRSRTTSGPSWFDCRVSGFLYVRATSCHRLHDLSPLYPSPPLLFGLLLHPHEVAWASHLPLRLLLSWGHKLGDGAYPFPLISDRDREPVFGDASPTGSILSIFPTVGGVPEICLIHVPELEILISSEFRSEELPQQQDQGPEPRLQLLLRRSSHEHVRRMVRSLGHSDSLLFGMAGDFSPSADSHLVCVAQSSGSSVAFRTEVTSALSTSEKKLTGASFVVIEGGASQSCLSVVEDGCMVRLTTEQFKALISKMRSASPLQLHVETAQVRPSSSPATNSGALITVDWLDNPISVHPTTVHYSWIDGRLVEPRCTFPVPPEHQLRHWMTHQSLAEAQTLSPSSSSPISEICSLEGGPRIAWTRLHSLSSQPVYAVDNRSGDALDLFAVFNTIASTFIGVQ